MRRYPLLGNCSDIHSYKTTVTRQCSINSSRRKVLSGKSSLRFYHQDRLVRDESASKVTAGAAPVRSWQLSMGQIGNKNGACRRFKAATEQRQ
jgi:hypothetical protein